MRRTIGRRRGRTLGACLAVILLSGCAATMPHCKLSGAIHTELAAAREAYGFPGVTAAIVQPDATYYAAASGFADVESETPMQADSRMLAASIGKTFVSATVLSLAADGVLSLDDPVAVWLGERPWYSRVPNAAKITLRHLLMHTGGLPDHVHDPAFGAAFGARWRDPEPLTPEELVAFILDDSPLSPAGSRFHYSDTGYILLGMVVEAASGQRYYDVVKQRFIRPLALAYTAPADRRNLPGLAAGYTDSSNAFGLPRKTTVAPGVLAWHPGIEWTGGGLVSNSRDLAVWGHALFKGQVLTDAGLATMLEPGPPHDDSRVDLYGAGVAIASSEFGRTYGHRGWIPGYVSSLRYYPRHCVSIALQINADSVPSGDIAHVLSVLEGRLAELAIRSAGASCKRQDVAASLRN